MTRKILLLTALLGLTAVPSMFAQIDPYTIEYSWGGVHTNHSQVLALNVSVDDSCSAAIADVTLTLYDKTGKTVATKTGRASAGHTFTFAIGPENTSARSLIDADIYLLLPAVDQTIVPCIKVAFPPGPCRQPTRLVTPTMETIDAATGRLVSFANNPHALIGLL